MTAQVRRAVPVRIRSRVARNKWVWKKRFEAEMNRRPRPVVVWSMQSSGSTTVQHVVEVATGERVLHVHSLNPHALAWRWEGAVARGVTPHNRREFIISPWLAQQLERATPSEPWNFVSMARNPVDRAVSHFFQGSGREIRALTAAERARPSDARVAEFVGRFENFPHIPTSIHWFDVELRAVTGIDVYAEPFPLDRGWQVYDGGRTRCLIVRTEDLARAGPPALAEFLSLEQEPVQARNSAETKAYAALYQRFRQEAVISDRVLEGLLESRYARHFYTDDEREATYRRWSKR